MNFAERTRWDLAPSPLIQKFNQLKDKGVSLLELTESNPTCAGFSYPKEILKALSSPENLIYSPDPKGMPTARKIIARYYAAKGVRVLPEQIILTASTSEAYSFIFRLLANPQDQILAPRPSYPLFDYLASLNDIALVDYPLHYEKEWSLDVEAIRNKINPLTQAILLVSPHNPCGHFVKYHELAGLNELAVPIIADEVFSDYGYSDDPRRVATLAGNDKVLTFTLSGVSKVLGLPQMKLSWIVVSGPPKDVRQALGRLEMISDTYLSVSTPAQHALKSWFAAKDKIQSQIRSRLNSNRNVLQGLLSQAPSYQYLESEGGWYAVIRAPQTIQEEDRVSALLEKDHVWVHPGYFFDFPREAYLVASLLTPAEIFRKGLEKILHKKY